MSKRKNVYRADYERENKKYERKEKQTLHKHERKERGTLYILACTQKVANQKAKRYAGDWELIRVELIIENDQIVH